MRLMSSRLMPWPVSLTSTTTVSSSARVREREPAAARHGVARVQDQVEEDLLDAVLVAAHGGQRRSASSLRTRMRDAVELVLEQGEHVEQHLVDVERLELGAARAREVQQAVDDLGRAEGLLLDLLEQRGSAGRSGSICRAASACRRRCRRAGVFTSWATPAARRPIEAIFSECWSCSSRRTRAVTSSRIRIVPQRSPEPTWNGRHGDVHHAGRGRRRVGQVQLVDVRDLLVARRAPGCRAAPPGRPPGRSRPGGWPSDLVARAAVERLHGPVPAHDARRRGRAPGSPSPCSRGCSRCTR